MRYLIVNHIAAARGFDGAHLRLPRAWARDLAATARACATAGVQLAVATPVAELISDDTVEVVPDSAGFEHVEIPSYHSARSFLAAREALATRLEEVISAADVVQLDHGGHPIPLGVVADPIARFVGRRRLWMISGDRLPDPRLAHTARTTARRLMGRPVDARVRRLWADALRSADAIVTHDSALTRELHRTLGIASTPITTIDAAEADIASQDTLSLRRARLSDSRHTLRVTVVGEQTVARGTDHVLRAMQRCRRLGMPIELLVAGRGPEIGSLARLAESLHLAGSVTFTDDLARANDADLLIEPALTDRAQNDIARPLAAGLAPIAYDAQIACEGVVNIARGDLDALTAALFDAAIRRDVLIGRMLRGVAWARERTIDVAHRRRIELARLIGHKGQRGAA